MHLRSANLRWPQTELRKYPDRIDIGGTGSGMGFWRRTQRSERLPNISVYCLSSIVDGIAKSKPLGVIPRFPDVYETDVKKRHRPAGSIYINEEFHGKRVILLWNGSSIEAISFMTAEDAESCAGFKPFASDDLVRLDPILSHFPR